MPPILIIGYGNPLRGDDGAGWHVARRVAEIIDSDTVCILTAHQLMPEMAEDICRVDLLILVDAESGLPAGQIRRHDLVPAPTSDRPMTHHQSPEGLLAMARDLYGRAPSAVLFTVGGQDFGYSEQITPPVKAGCDALVQQIIEMVRRA